MKTRPVRLAPCAAGASPTITTRASGSPNPSTGRVQYSSPAKRRGGFAAASSRHATSRGQRLHPCTSSATRSSESLTADPPGAAPRRFVRMGSPASVVSWGSGRAFPNRDRKE